MFLGGPTNLICLILRFWDRGLYNNNISRPLQLCTRFRLTYRRVAFDCSWTTFLYTFRTDSGVITRSDDYKKISIVVLKQSPIRFVDINIRSATCTVMIIIMMIICNIKQCHRHRGSLNILLITIINCIIIPRRWWFLIFFLFVF